MEKEGGNVFQPTSTPARTTDRPSEERTDERKDQSGRTTGRIGRGRTVSNIFINI